MTSLRTITEAFSRFMNYVAEFLVAALGKARAPRRVRLVQQEDESFTVAAPGRVSSDARDERVRIGGDASTPPSSAVAALCRGSRIELVLLPKWFLSRPFELPKRATEFLDGIVRAQIDRLTPWNAVDAVFGWTPPRPLEKERIELTVVATARTLIAPYLAALRQLGAGSVIVSTWQQDATAAATSVKVLDMSLSGALELSRLRGVVTAVFLAMGLAAATAVIAGRFVSDTLETQQQELTQRIAERRAAMRRAGLEGALPAQRMLERRKRETPSSVIVLEALSQILPDHTYVTELRVEGDKLQLIGVTRDAPSLIRLIEQSPHFTRATFFAPTTRSAGDPGERFHIEARIKPVFGSPT